MISQIQTRNVLFIGNSYTSVNNLPQIIADVTNSAGDVLSFDSSTLGGYSLLQHSMDNVTLSKISAGNWDYVILQGQSQEPILHENDFYEGAENLRDMIKLYNPCGVPQFYITWGRKNGDQLNCANIPIMCTYEGMDDLLKLTYLSVADYLRAEVSPVSVVWRYLRQNFPSLELYQADESHPSQLGSYAAACCFYTTIFKKDPNLITYNYTLNPSDAAIIRNAVKICVFDYMDLWDYKQLPIANFNYNIGQADNEVLFTSGMQNQDSFLWDFGDGTTNSTTLNPTHTYANNGTYTVTLTASNCDLEGMHQSIHETTINFCSHTPSVTPEKLMLCYDSSGTLWTQPADSYQWYDNGISIPGANNQSLEVFYLLDGTLTVTNPSVMTTINGCSELSVPTLVKKYVWSDFGDFLLFDITVNGNVINGNQVCVGETLILTASYDATHYSQWYKDDVEIPFATSDVLTVTETGVYKVRIDHPVCESMRFFSDSYMEPLSFDFIDCSLNNNEQPIVSINPETNLLNIKINFPIQKIIIYDMLGKKIIENSIGNNYMDVSNLVRGIYIVNIITKDGKSFSLKFIKP